MYTALVHSELYIHGRLTPAQKVKPNMAEFEGVLVRSELYIHGRLTPAQKVKPKMAEFEAILVRHPQSSTCTTVRFCTAIYLTVRVERLGVTHKNGFKFRHLWLHF